jgi:hypothetical protein
VETRRSWGCPNLEISWKYHEIPWKYPQNPKFLRKTSGNIMFIDKLKQLCLKVGLPQLYEKITIVPLEISRTGMFRHLMFRQTQIHCPWVK